MSLPTAQPPLQPPPETTPSSVATRSAIDVVDYLDHHRDEMIASLQDLVRIPSVSGSTAENDIQADVAGQLSRLGMDVDHWRLPLDALLAADDFPGVEVNRDEAYGVVGLAPGRGDGSSLLLNLHLDVVPPGDLAAWHGVDPFAAAVVGSTVTGRGTCDMKGGAVAALWAVRALIELGVSLRGDLLVAGVLGEEDGGLGTYATLARGWRADACVIPEPTSLDIVIANGGSLTFRLRVVGHASHASRRSSGVSAIEKFVPVFRAIRRLEMERNAVIDPLMAKWDIAYPIEVGRIHGGDWSSSVPDLLIAEGRYGVALGEDPAEARAQFAAAIGAACSEDPWLADHPVEVEWWGGQFASGRTDPDAPIVAALRSAHRRATGSTAPTAGVPYGSDLRLMTDLAAIPTVHYGPGDAGVAHGPRELVPVAEMLTTARTLALLIIDHCGVG